MQHCHALLSHPLCAHAPADLEQPGGHAGQARRGARGEGGEPDDASPGAAYEEAMRAYERACQLSASEAGDDLPGLLHNWGVGLHSLGTHAQVRSCHRRALRHCHKVEHACCLIIFLCSSTQATLLILLINMLK